jgi:hypothetical protein
LLFSARNQLIIAFIASPISKEYHPSSRFALSTPESSPFPFATMEFNQNEVEIDELVYQIESCQSRYKSAKSCIESHSRIAFQTQQVLQEIETQRTQLEQYATEGVLLQNQLVNTLGSRYVV